MGTAVLQNIKLYIINEIKMGLKELQHLHPQHGVLLNELSILCSIFIAKFGFAINFLSFLHPNNC